MTYKKKRLKLVWQIDEQSKKCSCQDNYDNCDNCKVIRELGLKLEDLINEHRLARGVEVIKQREKTEVKLKVSKYHEYKEKGLSDKAIAKKKKVTISILNLWKRENGLIGGAK